MSSLTILGWFYTSKHLKTHDPTINDASIKLMVEGNQGTK